MSRAQDARPFGQCRYCNKQAYQSRKDARLAGKRRFKGEHIQAYKCPHILGGWHIGHSASEVVAGQYTRDEFYGPNGAGRAIHRRKPAERVRDAA